MNAAELTQGLKLLSPEEQTAWMLRLGFELTVAARDAAYGVGTELADGQRLRGFNEIQHRVYSRLRAVIQHESWTEESFIAMLRDTSMHFGIATEVLYAIERSLKL